MVHRFLANNITKKIMSKNKMTAVKWLERKLSNRKKGKFDGLPHLTVEQIYDKAKAMERERIIEAYKVAFSIDKNYVSDEIAQLSAENYYRETYENNSKA